MGIRTTILRLTRSDEAALSRAEKIVDSAMGPTQDTWVEMLSATEHALDLAKTENARLRARIADLERATGRGLLAGLRALIGR